MSNKELSKVYEFSNVEISGTKLGKVTIALSLTIVRIHSQS